ncbi:MAG: hypothetical protein NC904_08280, partial [Candidatus Omnitrophica bacterium]|nr:hypothetical protein [Candidatus Omnitrophota bacterium]
TIDDIQNIFNQAIATHSATLGYVVINNRQRTIILELKTASGKEANKALQRVDFIRRVNKRVARYLEGKLSNLHLVNMYGETFIEYKLIDKKETLIKFIDECSIKNPFVIAIGDSATDYGFLNAPLTKIISYLVGIPAAEGLKLPETVKAFPIIGPEGTERILAKLLEVFSSSPIQNYDLTVQPASQTQSENIHSKNWTSKGFTLKDIETAIKIKGLSEGNALILKQLINQLLEAITKTGP